MAFDAPNFTQTPNIFIDEYMRNLSSAEVKTMLVILRYTTGYHRRRAPIAISTFIKMTGLSRQGIINNIESMQENGWIKVFKGNASIRNEYEIVIKDPVEDENIKEEHTSQLSRPASQLSRPELVNSVDQRNKERKLDKENNNPPTAAAPPKETSAPVATSSVAPTAVVVSSFLEDLEIRNSLKIKLTKTYTEDQIKKAVDCLKEITPNNLEATLQAALNEGWEPKCTPEDQVEKNQEFLETIRSADGKKHGPYRVEVGPKYIHFRHSCIDGSKDIHYNVEDKGFLVAVKDIISQHKTRDTNQIASNP